MATKKLSVVNTHHNPVIDWVVVTLDGHDYRLAFSFNALARAEAETGLDLLKTLNFTTGLNASTYRALLWCAMLLGQPETTIEDAGNLCSIQNLSKITDGIMKAYGLSMPAADPAELKKTEPTNQN